MVRRSPRASHRVGTRRRHRNPPASREEYGAVNRIVRDLLTEVDPRGGAAVVLAGSWARGDAHQASDIDLWVVGRRGRDRILEREGYMVCVKFSRAEDERREMRNPGRLDGAVPGWRHAKILRDPKGVARALRAEARRFRWSSVRRARTNYIANQLAGWAEEVAKLLRALETGERETAAVQRNLLANHMAFLRLIARGRLWETENGLWEAAGALEGPEFRSLQRAALATDRTDWEGSCEAALRLYALTARLSRRTLRGQNLRIVLAACRRAGYPLE